MSAVPTRHYRVPRGILGQFVEILWLHDGYSQIHTRERMLPTSTTELVVDIRSLINNSQRATVVGPHSEHWVLETSSTSAVVGVHFRPGGAFPFFGVPAGELHNERVSLDTLWGSRAAPFVEEVQAATTPAEKLDVLEKLLLRAACTLTVNRSVAFAMKELSVAPAPRSIADVTQSIGMSQRRFREHFRDEVGMPPKLFARVQRFQAAVETVDALNVVNWADVAASCGYFDQAHFIHDFRAFSGFTPATYFALKGENRNHVPLN